MSLVDAAVLMHVPLQMPSFCLLFLVFAHSHLILVCPVRLPPFAAHAEFLLNMNSRRVSGKVLNLFLLKMLAPICYPSVMGKRGKKKMGKEFGKEKMG